MDLGINLYTQHISTQSNPNNVTPGIYANFDGPTLGTYYNSARRQSLFGGWVFETQDKRFAILAGAVSGYRENGKDVIRPMLIPSYKMDLVDKFSFRISFIPKPPHGFSSGFNFSLEYSLD